MRGLLIGAIAIGGLAGYAWTVASADVPTYGPRPSAEAVARKNAVSPALVQVPQTEEQNAADSAWSAGQSASEAQARHAVEKSISYAGCNEVRALGKAPLYAGDPGYRPEMDGDGDGVACEPIRNRG